MQVSEGIHLIEVPTPFPVGPVNCYLIEGSPVTLVDTGVKSSLALAKFESGLSDTGYEIEDIEQVCLTHGHVDHIGLVKTIIDRSKHDVKVWIHEMDSSRITAYEEYIDDRMHAYHRIAFESGASVESGILDSHNALAAYFLKFGESVPEVLHATDGDLIKSGLGDLTTVWVPGHSLGSLCYALKSQHVLFSGDHVLGDISSNPSLDFDGILGISILRYFESLEKIRRYSDYLVLPGHRSLIHDLSARIEALLSDYDEKLERASQHITSTPISIYKLSRYLYGEYDDSQLILALAETQDLVRVLETRGVAQLVKRESTYYAQK
ncbi:MAG: MBL fold metallo-hydrolase [Candidatus Thorarchaeota archaeon]